MRAPLTGVAVEAPGPVGTTPDDREDPMADDQHYDVVVIGNGAAGGTLGHRLAVPSLTAIANALRVGDHLLERLR
jgi:hypothetical protein